MFFFSFLFLIIEVSSSGRLGAKNPFYLIVRIKTHVFAVWSFPPATPVYNYWLVTDLLPLHILFTFSSFFYLFISIHICLLFSFFFFLSIFVYFLVLSLSTLVIFYLIFRGFIYLFISTFVYFSFFFFFYLCFLSFHTCSLFSSYFFLSFHIVYF